MDSSYLASFLVDHGVQFLNGPVDTRAADVPVGDHAHGVDGGVLGPDAALVQGVAEFDGVHAGGAAIEDDNVGFYRSGINFQAGNSRDALGRVTRVGVVLMQARRRMFEGQKARSGNDANLAHSAAEHFAIDAGALDKFAGAEDHGPDRSAEAFREAEHHGINFLGHVGDVVAERSRSVKDACAVQVHFQAECVGTIADFVHAGRGINGATGHVAGIFQTDKGGLRVVINFGPDGGFDLVPGKDAVVAAADSARHATRYRGHRCKFVEVDVAALFAKDFVSVVGPDFDGDEVAHAARGNEQSRFLPEDFRSAFLELVDRGIFAVNVVAHFGGGHGAAHFVAGARDGIAAEINSALDGRNVVGVGKLIPFCDGVSHGYPR